jgi:hypothetical protein
MQIFDDGTIFMTEVPKITGKECDSADRVRLYRERKKELLPLQCNSDVTKCNDNIYIEEQLKIKNINNTKEKEKENYKEKKEKEQECPSDDNQLSTKCPHRLGNSLIWYWVFGFRLNR